MDRLTVINLLKERLNNGPRQERLAARFILENAQEVAVLSMRDQAKLANVPPSTMTRLAKKIGFEGFDQLREIYIESVRSGTSAYGGRAGGLIELTQRIGGKALVQDMAANAIAHIQALCSDENVAAIVRASKLLANARQVYALGIRSSFSVAFQFTHVASYFARNVRLVEGAGESGVMSVLNQATNRDVLLVCSVPRYSRRAHTLTNFCHQQGVTIVAITDSPVAPIARFAKETIIVRNAAPAFFDTVVPAILVSEVLVALLSAAAKDVKSTVTAAERRLLDLGEWLESP